MLGQVVALAAPTTTEGNKDALAAGGEKTPLAACGSPRAGLISTRGKCRPLGASVVGDGVNFAVFSRHAQSMSLVLAEEGRDEIFAELPLDPVQNRTGDIWHIYVHKLPPNILYGYRVQGPFAPRMGHRFNPRAVLLDPYARAICGGHPFGLRQEYNQRPARMGKIIANDEFDWGDDLPPNTPAAQTVIYEMHVRGFTRHASAHVTHPGSYLGIIDKIPYLKWLGVTAVQLMPLMEFDENDGDRRNPETNELLRNYWGYSPLSWFAIKAGYAARAGQQNREFKELVKALHKAGMEVILDVVYNHTNEGDEHGATISLRGLDNAVYYMLDKEGRYWNYTGCGNTVNCNHAVVRDLIIDSLTEMVTEYHVDGFRFDLAAIMARGTNGKPMEEPTLLQQIAEHPILASTKLIAEAWDAGGLYMIGKFPAWGRWTEFNGPFRDEVRRFVRSEPGIVAGLAKRITGSLDFYGKAKHPYHSLNFVTCHDGFTMWDLVSYTRKHNLANGENNRDGWDDNVSYNCGQEGPCDEPEVVKLRQRQMRNFFTLLMVSQGMPLILMGDEFARTQRGNNNAYCQDNEISWVDWSLLQKNQGLARFVAQLIALRKKYFAMSREQFLARASWHGTVPEEPDWTGQSRALALQLLGGQGQPTFYLIFNAHWEAKKFTLPQAPKVRWRRLVDTSLPSPDDVVEEKNAVPIVPGEEYTATARSTVILVG